MEDLIMILNDMDIDTLTTVCEDLKYGLVINNGKITAVIYE